MSDKNKEIKYHPKEIDAVIELLCRMMGTTDFKREHMSKLMDHVQMSRHFDPLDYCEEEHYNNWDYNDEDAVEMFMITNSDDKIESVMRQYNYVPNIKGTPNSTLADEDKNELLSKLFHKFGTISQLESFIGEELMAEFRGFDYEKPDNTVVEKKCICDKVVGNESYEIERCCRYNNTTPQNQWVGRSKEVDYFQTVCPCGKVSKSFSK